MKKNIKDKKKKRKKYAGDDGRVIASMEFLESPDFQVKKKGASPDLQESPLTKKESFNFIASALAAALLIGFIFLAVFALFIGLLLFYRT